MKYKIIITDLDGTLLNDNAVVSEVNRKKLIELAENKTIRVIATGRNLYSVKKVLPENFPIDYLIFSSGAGIFNWQTQELIFVRNISQEVVNKTVEIFNQFEISFAIHHPVPESHRFAYWLHEPTSSFFEHRLNLYADFAYLFNRGGFWEGDASQLLAILPPDVTLFQSIKSKINYANVIRSTSPTDGIAIWLEIFHSEVSKGTGVEWLCKYLNVSQSETVGVGNDYNDIDLLDFTAQSFLVANAPAELKQNYKLTQSNNNDGFALVAEMFFN